MSNIDHSLSPATRQAYKSDLKHFSQWLSESGTELQLPVDPGRIADYLTFLDDKNFSPATMDRRLRAISWMHRVNGVEESPASSLIVRMNMKGIKRQRAQQNRKTTSEPKQAATVDILRAIIKQIDTSTIQGKRDKALLLIGWAGALRRSELAALTTEEINITGMGADIRIRKSKTDQTGQGETISIFRGHGDLCPVMALVDWYRATDIINGPVFLRIWKSGKLSGHAISPRSVSDIIKKYCHQAGFDEKKFAGHSLRSGMLTSAAENGSDLIPLAQHARHKNLAQTMHYIKQANRYKNNPTDGLL